MIKVYRAAAAALVLGGAAVLAGGSASAATAGNFSPLKSVVAEAKSGVEQANYGRRCFRDCRVGRHGRTYCSWECHRPHRWW